MIIQAPNAKLSEVCHDCTWPEAKEIHKLLLKEVRQAEKQAKDYRVAGLAAPQVGWLVRAFTAFDHVFINPRLTWHSDATIDSQEGCLSLGTDVFKKKRYQRIHLSWLNKSRQFNKSYFVDSAAVIIQHEIDHLEGKMIND